MYTRVRLRTHLHKHTYTHTHTFTHIRTHTCVFVSQFYTPLYPKRVFFLISTWNDTCTYIVCVLLREVLQSEVQDIYTNENINEYLYMSYVCTYISLIQWNIFTYPQSKMNICICHTYVHTFLSFNEIYSNIRKVLQSRQSKIAKRGVTNQNHITEIRSLPFLFVRKKKCIWLRVFYPGVQKWS